MSKKHNDGADILCLASKFNENAMVEKILDTVPEFSVGSPVKRAMEMATEQGFEDLVSVLASKVA